MCNNGESQAELHQRLRAADRLHELSYRVVSHYDSKIGPLLTLIGINFAVVGFILAGFFRDMDKLNGWIRLSVILFCAVNFSLVARSLLLIRKALSPHVDKVAGPKPKLGLTYFKDVLNAETEEGFVKMFLGQQPPPASPYYETGDANSLIKCLIEDDCRDIYAHAEILNVKTKAVSLAFRSVCCTMVVLFASIILLGIIYAANIGFVPPRAP